MLGRSLEISLDFALMLQDSVRVKIAMANVVKDIIKSLHLQGYLAC